jgi:uncharacterized protein YndB with AHSA1/START domain
MKKTISTIVDIPVPREAVWEVLTDFAAYGEWNLFMDRVTALRPWSRRPRTDDIRFGA